MSDLTEDESWIFDSLVFFLNGPIWDAPVQSFIEEKSLIFEPNNLNNPEYLNIYEEYKNLVDFMLGNFMDDIGISAHQFETACAKGSMEGISLQFHQNNFEQIWAANDYELFVRMMTQRNVQLQLQALELIEQKYGITPDSFKPHKSDEDNKQNETKADINPFQSSKQFEREVLQEISKQFSADTHDEADQFLLEDKEILHKSLEDKIAFLGEHKALRTNTPVQDFDKVEEEVEDKPEVGKVRDIPGVAPVDLSKQQTEVSGADLKKRQDYLRAQRDKLVALKKEARKKHLDAEKEPTDKARMRPKSAKAAKKILDGTETIEPQQLQIRKTLAEKIKNEVMGTKDDTQL